MGITLIIVQETFFSSYLIKNVCGNVCFPEIKRKHRENKWLYPSCCSPTGYMPDSGMGGLHCFQLIVACSIHAALFQVHSTRWLPTSMETFCSAHYSIYRPLILVFKPVTPLVCALSLQTRRFEQTTLTTILSNSSLSSVWARKLTVPLETIPTVD